MGALQTNVEYLTDRIINNNSNTSNVNYAAGGSALADQNLVAHSSNDFDMDPQILNQESALDQNEGTRAKINSTRCSLLHSSIYSTDTR